MPYIKKERRIEVDKIVDLMKQSKIQIDGDLNYLLYKFIKDTVNPSYKNYKNVIGELECCKLELYRRLISDYETLKIKENGDV